ncbi:MAG: hypothetical protein KGL93_06015, partial [Gemmatimonadota bacterium]|nr:hypothetical protein [Gemmatimonadota bacterium]
GAQQADQDGRTLLPMKVARSIAFRSIGPAVSGGRVSAVAGVPGQNDTYYVGTADGGIFRTTNGGITWTPEFQHQHALSIGALAVDPVNPEVIWAGTGEGNVRNNVSFGDGVFKSTDGGAHWTYMGLKNTRQIPRIAIDPNDPNTVLVAAMGNPWKDDPERGVFRTRDGGRTWERVLYISPEVGAADVVIDPVNPEIVYAATYKFRRTPWSFSDGGPEDAIYKSVDGGSTWTRLVGHGLPTTPISRVGLAVAPSEHDRVYAAIGSSEGAIWRSDDAGENWQMVSDDQEANVRSFYFSHVAVDPTNPEHVFTLSMFLMDSHDGGKHFTAIAQQNHVDNHAIWIDPSGSGRIIEGNDGGVILSRDDGAHWQFLDNIAIGQFYHVAANDQFPYLVCGGLQDNSSWCGPGWSQDPNGVLNRDWFAMNGGDGIYAIPAPDNPNLIYNSTQNGFLMTYDRSTRQVHDMEPYPFDFGGDGVAGIKYRQDWEAGFAVSPQNPKVLYAGANVVFKSTDRGRSWTPISPDLTLNDKSKQGSSGGPVMKDNSGAEVYDAILIVAPSPDDSNTLWVGTDDGLVQVTRDGGAHWSNVTSHIPGLPAWGRIESIKLGAPGHAVIAADRHFLGDFAPYVYVTDDYGQSWRSITGDLPGDIYARSAMQDPHNPHMYYAGLENGLYTTWDDGAHWYLMGLGLPNVSVYDMTMQPQTNDLILGTHGRSIWIFDDMTPFEQYTPAVARQPLHLFPIRTAHRFWHWSEVEELGDGTFYGGNPAYGAMITYSLGDSASEPGKLVITDAEGHVVRTMSGVRELGPNESAPDETAPTGDSLPPLPKPDTAKAAGAPWVPTNAGMHRIYWDLRADGPVRWNGTKEFNKGPQSGALVPPGRYTATLTINGHTESQSFDVLIDPRSHASPADLRAQYAFTSTLMHWTSQLDEALNRLDAMRAQAKALSTAVHGSSHATAVEAAEKSLGAAIDAVKAKITSDPQAIESTVRYPDMIREHIGLLEGGAEGSDQAPTPAQVEQMHVLEPEYRAAVQAFNDLLSGGVATFNKTMSGLGLTGVVGGNPIAP